jgi:WASH complex subunit strumpellin
MQRLLRNDSKNALLLRATFLKLVSILNFPLIRLFEIDSEDIESVTNYYSGELVKFVKNILQVIPRRVFELMQNVSKIFKGDFKEMPIKILKNDIQTYSQPEARFELARAVHGISMITKGIFMMEKTLMGVIEVDPNEILEEGIRKELLSLLAKTFQTHIDFGISDKIDFIPKMNKLITEINAIKKSFIYIQDYVNMNGSKMWSEEMHRLINYYVEIEANKFLSRKIKNKKDKYEIFKYNIPTFPPCKTSPESYTFLGRLTRYVLNLTEPKNVTFCPLNYTWYEKEKYDKEVFGIKQL